MGVKFWDFSDFSEIAQLIKNKAHFTFSGLEKIKKLKSQMNSNREVFSTLKIKNDNLSSKEKP